jgi:tetrahydrodipicolinate N-succinyltransferase
MHEHPVDYISTSPITYGRNNIFGRAFSWNDFGKPPVVGNDVWIGSAAQVLQGVTIGDGSIIAAGAIVTKDVPPYAIVAGVPARIIRYRFEPSEIDILLRLKWWDMSPSEIGKLSDLFGRADWRKNAAISNLHNNLLFRNTLP